MNIEFRSDRAIITGYVNCVLRESKPLPSPTGEFIEVIEQGAFKRSLERRKDVKLLLNHDNNRLLGSTSEGTLELIEANIGLKANAVITDKAVINKLRNDRISGWSFGFYVRDQYTKHRVGKPSKRYVKDLDLFEVSILDNTRECAYSATSVELREGKEYLIEKRFNSDSIEENTADPDAEKYNKFLEEIKRGLK